MGRKVKGYEYFICGFLFSLLFITLLRNQVRENGPGFLASCFSPNQGCPVCIPQGSFIDCKVRGALFNATGGPAGPNAGRPVILTKAILGMGGGSPVNTARHPQLCGWLDELIEKIHHAESGGQLDPPAGDNGRAVGALQMHKGAVDDVNRYYKTNFSYSDRSDFPKARLMAGLYVRMWMEKHREEIAARIFNGGPRGWEKLSTKKYWEKIEQVK